MNMKRLMVAGALTGVCLCARGERLSLAGEWRFALGETNALSDTICLPTTTDLAKKGDGRFACRRAAVPVGLGVSARRGRPLARARHLGRLGPRRHALRLRRGLLRPSGRRRRVAPGPAAAHGSEVAGLSCFP